MRRMAIALVTSLALVALAAGIGSPAASARSCGTVAAPGFHAFYVQTKGISCKKARRILQTWLNAGAKPTGGPHGWRCRKHFASPWRCKHQTAVISFIYHSY